MTDYDAKYQWLQLRRPQEQWHAHTSQVIDKENGEEVEDNPLDVDYGHRKINSPQCDEDTTLR
jgi:hypothetical protein